jgi:transcriptional regulator with XRE-family HTH domain
MSIQIELGARVRELRKKKGFSQERFADICGLHRSHMGDIERGGANITLSTLEIIAQKLQISPSALLKDLAKIQRSPDQA